MALFMVISNSDACGPGPRYQPIMVHASPIDAKAVSEELGVPVHFLSECASTNAVAKRLAPIWSGAPLAGLVVADHQTGGRGRLGRIWSSEKGQNLLFSAVLRPRIAPQMAARCVLVWAAAMAEVLDVQIKWPNDLVTADRRKLAGLLAAMESKATPQGPTVDHVVLGVGVNVNQTRFAGLPEATSLAQVRGGPQDRTEILAALGKALAAAPVESPNALDAWRARSQTLGQWVRVGDVEGLATGIRDDGALLIDGEPILAGDVQLITETCAAPSR
jgi:BirA family biotin operon repressor/biotin-[acetyl-CoA-carboxylase] ligase